MKPDAPCRHVNGAVDRCTWSRHAAGVQRNAHCTDCGEFLGCSFTEWNRLDEATAKAFEPEVARAKAIRQPPPEADRG